MKITIEIDECADYGLSPNYVYKRLCDEYVDQMNKKYSYHFWGMQHYCCEVARNLYANVKGRVANIKKLILTYEDAENLFDLFKQFAETWMKNVIEEMNK